MDSSRKASRTISVWGVAALGIGSMVGAGIFSLMGQASLAAGSEVPIAFIIGGAVALLSGYTYARLGVRYPSSGGIIDYFNTAFGPGTLAGGLSLVYLATLIMTVAMVSQAFGAYADGLLHVLGLPSPGQDVLAALIVILLAAINSLAANLVGKAELILVCIKLGILLLLIAVGIPNMGGRQGDDMEPVPLLSLFSSAGLTFFAYAGYGMMANASANIANPARNLPRAIFLSIGLVMTLYVVLSIVIMSQISPQELVLHADTAVAQAAAPLLGRAGYIAVAAAALVATSSAINATLFSILRISLALSKEGELQKFLARTFWKNCTWGFMLSMALILLLTMSFNLGETANIAGATFLITYLSVYAAHWKLRFETNTRPIWIILGLVTMLAVFLGFMYSLYVNTPFLLGGIALVIVVCLALEAWLQNTRRRT